MPSKSLRTLHRYVKAVGGTQPAAALAHVRTSTMERWLAGSRVMSHPGAILRLAAACAQDDAERYRIACELAGVE